MHGFYLVMECENCEEEIFEGPCATTTEKFSPDRVPLPVIPFDFASTMVFDCGNCGARHFTGEISDFVLSEGGRDVSEDDEDEDDDED